MKKFSFQCPGKEFYIHLTITFAISFAIRDPCYRA